MNPFIRQKKWRRLASSLFAILSLVLFSFNAKAQGFVTTWKTTDGQITIPTTGSGYNYDITWSNQTNAGVGDGFASGVTGNQIITSLSNGDLYKIEITGSFPRIFFNNTGDKDKILTVESWGTIVWSNMTNAFYGCTNLTVPATDAPDLSSVLSVSQMFRGATSFNQSIDHWDVSNIVNLYAMFADATSFNQPLNSWNIANATNLSNMFNGASSFNQPLDNWVTTGVTDMNVMFKNASSFNQPVNHFDVSLVTNFSGVFEGATAFNQPLDQWDVSSATLMGNMFYLASSFNQPLDKWDVSGVTDMRFMFWNATSFDQNLGKWDISSLTLANDMLWLSGLSATNYDLALIGWSTLDAGETQIPTSIAGFRSNGLNYCNGETARLNLINNYNWAISLDTKGCSSFITTWQTTDTQITIPTNGAGYNYDLVWTNLTNATVGDGSITGQTGDYTITGLENNSTYQVEISGTFPQIYFNNVGDKDKILTIEQWGTIAWTSMANAFYGCTNLTYNATDIPFLAYTIDLSFMFSEATSFNGNINDWDISTITNLYSMFFGASIFNQNLDNWDVSNVKNMGSMFQNASAFNGNISKWNTSSLTYFEGIFSGASTFNQDLSGWNVSGVTSFGSVFYGASAFNQNIDGWNVSGGTIFDGMFTNASTFNQNLNSWNVSNATTMNIMFYGATNFNGDISAWQVGNVTTMAGMFENANSFNQNISTWDVSKVQNMSSMFRLAYSFNQNISGWITNMVSDFSYMFNASYAFNAPISSWNVSSATNMSYMFSVATAFNQDLSGWNVSGVSDFSQMFSNASSFNQDLSTWNISSATTMTGMLDNSGLSVFSYDATLAGWDALATTPSGISLGATGMKYCLSESSRTTLISTNTWTITGDVMDCTGVPLPEINVYVGTNNTGTAVTDAQASAIDFGSDYQGTDIVLTFAIENTGTADLNISSVTVSGTDYSVTSAITSIASGVTETFTVTLSGVNTGTFNATVTINNDDMNENPFTFDVTGIIAPVPVPEINVYEGIDNTGVAITDAQAAVIDLGSVFQGTDITQSFAIENTGTADLNISSITVSGTDYSVTSTLTAIPAGATQTFTVTLSGTNTGTFNTTVTIANDDSNENPFTFDLTGVISAVPVPEINVYEGIDNTGVAITDAQAAVIDLGSVFQGTDISQSFAIENTGTANLNISSITVSGTDYSVTSTITAIPAGATQTFTVTLSGTNTGTFNTTVTIANDDSNENPFTFDLTGVISAVPVPKINVYEGIDNTGVAITDAQTAVIDLGSVFQGTDITQSFAIENTGTADLNISSITVSGTDYSVTSTITAIPAGTTQTFTVTLSGTNTGTFNTTVTIANDDSNENPFTFDLTGVISTVLEPEINVFVGTDNTGTSITDGQTTAIDLGSALQGTDITQTFAIENTGTTNLNIGSITVNGTDYIVSSTITAIAIGATQTFTVTLSGTNIGTFNTTVTIANDDSNENPFTFDITGAIDEVVVKEDANSGGGVVISNQTVDLGSTVVNVDIDKIFVIENPSTLNTLSITNISSDNTAFEILNPPTSIPPASSDQFVVRLLASGAGTYTGTISVFTNLADITFNVSGEVLPENNGDIKVYNVVTPNGDGIHDFLKIENITNFPNNKVIIYNRWGDKVYEATGYDNQGVVFDGTDNIGSNQELDTGNFYYSIDKGNGDKFINGFIFLKR